MSGASFQLAGSGADMQQASAGRNAQAGSGGYAQVSGSGGNAKAGSGGSSAVAGNGESFEVGGSGGNSQAGNGGSFEAGGSGGSLEVAGSSAGAAGASGSSGSGAGVQPVTVSFEVTTAANGGRYQPKNIGAIWIESSSGTFVKTLALWAKLRRRYLTTFNGAVGTTGLVDVTASATLSNHITHSVTWDHRDRSGSTLNAGAFRVCVELTDDDVTGPYYCLDFDTSAGNQSLTPADQHCFKSLSLTIQ